MASTTTRLGIQRWDQGSDPFTRAQMDSSHAALETLAAGYQKDVGGGRPAATDALEGFIYIDTTTTPATISVCMGQSDGWRDLTNEFGSPTGLSVGGSNADGTSSLPARADHEHALPGWGSDIEDVQGANAPGTSTTFARSDHVHTLADDVVTSDAIAASAIQGYHLHPDAIGEASITDGSLEAVKMQTNTFDEADINRIWNGNAQDASQTLKAQSVTVAELLDNDITGAKLVENGLTVFEFNRVVNGKVVDTAHLVDGAVESAAMGTNAINTTNVGTVMQDGSVGTDQLATGAVTNDEVGGRSLQGDRLALNSITADEIANVNGYDILTNDSVRPGQIDESESFTFGSITTTGGPNTFGGNTTVDGNLDITGNVDVEGFILHVLGEDATSGGRVRLDHDDSGSEWSQIKATQNGGTEFLEFQGTNGALRFRADMTQKLRDKTGAGAGSVQINTSETLLFLASAARYKKDVTSLDPQTSLEQVMDLRPVEFYWDTDHPSVEDEHGLPEVGLIAEEVQPIVPQVVSIEHDEDSDDWLQPKAVKYDQLIAVLIGAVQAQQEQIIALEDQLGRY